MKLLVLCPFGSTEPFGRENLEKIEKFGLLSTTGTYQTNLYKSGFEPFKLRVIHPDTRYQQITMNAIYGKRGIKAGYKKEPLAELLEVVDHLIQKGSEAIICGCTEISLVLGQEHLLLPLLDPLLILAKRSIFLAGYELKG